MLGNRGDFAMCQLFCGGVFRSIILQLDEDERHLVAAVGKKISRERERERFKKTKVFFLGGLLCTSTHNDSIISRVFS